ncbi:cysteine hydrolase family protein [Roseateles albus]|uniref:Cysteine hydrolase family protein n=1 Tax=Roseateles albus TaxID=2987525 RepID=A0ABT5KJM1_9BURK|nr:cysteine hydrolase family protein [Roseateles albus]MDC8774127.1 cysteine hydrolase family protein [Roseateles albus]
MHTALLIIDVQNALCFGEYAAFDSQGLIARINQVSAKAREAAAPVILIQHETKGGGPLDHGSEGWRLAKGLNVASTDVIIAKTATDSFHNTALQAELQSRGIQHLIICGLQSEFCVDTTTRRALGLGYAVSLISDGHSTIDNGILSAAQITAHHTATLANITSFGPRVTPVSAAALRID